MVGKDRIEQQGNVTKKVMDPVRLDDHEFTSSRNHTVTGNWRAAKCWKNVRSGNKPGTATIRSQLPSSISHWSLQNLDAIRSIHGLECFDEFIAGTARHQFSLACIQPTPAIMLLGVLLRRYCSTTYIASALL
jgi:hypothetical protein